VTEFSIRPPNPSDLDALVRFEIDIARISFPDDPVVDPEVHRKKLLKALERDREGMFVAERASTGEVVGWLWVSLNTNFLTGESYANFRSLATSATSHSEPGSADSMESAEIAERLFAGGIEYAQQHGVSEITGKVHVNNVPMRVIYRKFGFVAEHLTMKKRIT
jgi:ribosomal protein S18 acetylase RimI-like enzyme